MSMVSRDGVVNKALGLIKKLQHKYGFKTKFYDIQSLTVQEEELSTIYEEDESGYSESPAEEPEEGEWALVCHDGRVQRLPKTMVFLGREECDVELQSHTVDKRHAVVTFDHYLRRFKVKDLSTINGTYVNGSRIPEQEYVTLENRDSLRLGYDSTSYHMEKIEESARDQAGDDDVFQQNPADPPSWASSKDDSITSPMAECQGCIVEQRIEHTCCESIPESETAHHDLDRSYSADSISTFGLGCNTWPKKRHKARRPVKDIFVDMDHAAMNNVNNVEDLVDTAGHNRVTRGTGAPMNILPKELATVKKGTPLYGQPEWWGEDESDLNLEKLRSNGNMDHPHPRTTSTVKDHNISNMERTSVSDQSSERQYPQNGVHNPVPNHDIPARRHSTTPEGVSNTAFTIDFGEGDSKHNLDGKKLSEFMPSKIRKSFRERKEKAADKSPEKPPEKATPPKSTVKEKVTPETTPTTSSKLLGRAVSEGREISPTRLRKLDELWSSSNTSSESLSSKRARVGKGSHSRSMDLDDDKSGSSYTKGTKSSTVKRRPPVFTTLTKPKSVIRARKAVSTEVLAKPTQFTDNASYLIDKMFQKNSTGSVDNLKLQKLNSAHDSSTEYELYKESKMYDKSRSQDFSAKPSLILKLVSKPEVKEVPISILKKSTPTKDETSAKKPDETDKVSESGTYTIEEEKDSKEEAEARQNIDTIFGVELISPEENLGVIDEIVDSGKVDKQEELAQNLQDINDELREIERLEKLRAQRLPDSLDVEVGSVDPGEDVQWDDDDNPTVAVPGDAPKWVTQWAALTNQKSRNKSDMELSSPCSSISDDPKNANKQNGINLMRRGTGRRLPTIPPDATSPAYSDRSLTKESPHTSKSDLTTSDSTNALQERAVKISSHVSARYQDTDTESISLTKNDSGSESFRDTSRGRVSSNGSVASIDTDILLRDTEVVMAAIAARVGSKSKSRSPDRGLNHNELKLYNLPNGKHSSNNVSKSTNRTDVDDSVVLDESVDFESDASSTIALVNGDEDFIKPSFFKSPRDALGKGKLKLAESLPSKPVVQMGGAKTQNVEKTQKRSTVESKSVVSDILSDVNGDSTVRTNASDVSTEASQFVRQGSKGKGQMSMTRPNRAFQLRRARTDSDEPVESAHSVSTLNISATSFSTPRTGGSMSNVSKLSSTPQKSRRPISGRYGDRVKQLQPDSSRSQASLGDRVKQLQPDSSRSQASLGGQIVKRSQENARVGNFTRADGGRHSLRISRTMSVPQQPSIPTQPSKSRKSDVTPSNSSSQLKHSSSLRVTGVSAKERSSSVNKTSGTSSPRTAERNAWKRRKDYDPRRAVAESKSKDKQRRDQWSGKNDVSRSASFTNTRDLKLSAYTSDSVSISSADDLSRRSSVTSDVFDEHGGHVRGFVPYSARTVSSKLTYSSAEEEDSEKYNRSSSTQSNQVPRHRRSSSLPRRALLGSAGCHPKHVSAFTQPIRKNLSFSVYEPDKSPVSVRVHSPASPPPSGSSLSNHRRSLDSVELYQSALSRKLSPDSNSVRSTPLAQSYDTIIVSSIYQLSLKLKTNTDRTLEKLRENELIENGIDSPLDELDIQSTSSEIPAYKSANQELAGVLKNLRKLEQHLKVMNKVLFPSAEQSPDTSKEKQEYLQQIERIRNELAGFQPIETPRDDEWKHETQSLESDCEELGPAEFY